jgi:SNF2 family DNA or RNA helicase
MYGRLYVTGPSMQVLSGLPGAAVNPKRRAVELSLTLEMLRAMRQELGVSKAQFASYCTPGVIAWSKAAAKSEEFVRELHEKLETGWRPELPWLDNRAGTPADPSADEEYVEYTAEGVRVWKYRGEYNHQAIMAAMGLGLDGCAILGEVGTGKTRAAYEVMRELLHSGDLDVVIVAGKKATLDSVWELEAEEWTRDIKPILLRGPVPERIEMIKRIARGERVVPEGFYPVVLINHDVLRLMEDELLLLMRSKKTGIVIDESQKLRNPDAKMTQSGMRLANAARWRMIMTGSPVIRGEQDVWSQWYMVDLGVTFGPNFVQYRREWLVENPYTFKVSVKNEQAQTEIGLRMRRRGYRVTKEMGIPDLPPRVWQKELVELTREQKRAYEELERDLVTALSEESDQVATAANQLTMILRLSQITSGFVTDDQGETFTFDPNPKLNALQELVEENVPNGSIIIWAWYRQDVERIARALSEYAPAVVYGGQGDTARRNHVRRFVGRETPIMVSNQASGGVGMNWQIAPLAIYYSQNYDLENRLQSEGRNHRGGSQMHQQVTYIDLMATGTSDEIVLDALKHKKSVADAVVDLRRHIGLLPLAA